MLAPSAGIGIENARLYQEQQDRRLEAEGRHQMAESLGVMLAILNSERSLDEILDYIVTHVSNRLLDCQAMAIYSLQPNNGILSVQAAHGLPDNFVAAGNFIPGNAAIQQAVATAKPVAVPDAAAGSEEEKELSLTIEESALVKRLLSIYRAWLAVPLIVKGDIYGVILMYYNQPQAFSEEEISLAVVFSDQVALAIENARLRMQAEQAAVMAERNRLARELHDAVSQTLFSISLIADVLPRLWDRNQAKGRQSLEELRQLTRGASAEMRTLLYELRPAYLKESKLGDLLKQLTRAMSGRTRIPISLTLEGERPLSEEVKIALYRITQEALNNVGKYANPTQVSVTFRCQPEQVELIISDDGCGFDPSYISPEHLGLGIMHERAVAINAVMKLNSRPGCGTQIEVVWPVPTSKEQP
jgi:two-component system nitrate/nitrite sensor histidine kinase NarX